MHVGVKCLETPARQRMLIECEQCALGVVAQRRQLSAIGRSGRAIPHRCTEIIIIDACGKHVFSHRFEAIEMVAEVIESHLLVLRCFRFEAQPRQDFAQSRTKAHRCAADQVTGHGLGCVTLLGPRQHMGLTLALTVKGLELAIAWGLWRA